MKTLSYLKKFLSRYNFRYKEVTMNSIHYYHTDKEVVYFVSSGNEIIYYFNDFSEKNSRRETLCGRVTFSQDRNYTLECVAENVFAPLLDCLSKTLLHTLLNLLKLRDKLLLKEESVCKKILLMRLNKRINNLNF